MLNLPRYAREGISNFPTVSMSAPPEMEFPHVLVGLERVARLSTCAIFTVGPITILPLSAFSFR